MRVEKSYTVQEAIEYGFLQIGSSAIVAENVRFIRTEDNGTSAPIIIGAGTRLREGCIISSGVVIGSNSIIGHNVVVRQGVRVGDNTVISHMVCLEKSSQVGNHVRISALTHITGGCIIEDNVQVGAREVTINDRQMRRVKTPDLTTPGLKAPILRQGCRVGSGATLMAGVEVGRNTLVGAGAVVTKNLPENVIAFGVPAYIQAELTEPEDFAREL
ncbi:MAG TPA: DapH/DapD/GlmU-related protein [Ktedonosporobacter sp.]|nr:DapH/DapD/GlmU-related protein [Ktedonosporobacter sp.]